MKITVFGLGYVGVVSAACLSRDGHDIIGVDPNSIKTDMIANGDCPIIEPGLDRLVADGVDSGKLTATEDYSKAIADADVVLVCVGTPSKSNGSLNLEYVKRVCEQIGHELKDLGTYPVITMRSTMLPGSMETLAIPTLESASGKKAGQDFGVCINPEFLREGSAIYDYDNPPKTVIGANDERSAEVLASIYAGLDAPLIVTQLKVAEMIKYADNSWHALKVTFANEIGRVCKALEVDSRKVMHIFCQDRKLNISPNYLLPGFAFGGSCLPKDLRALTYQGRQSDVETPVLSSILSSNQFQVDAAYRLIEATGSRKIGLLGLSFKEGTDDLRESPIVNLAERLIGKGYELSIFDRNVKLASLVGANKEYILHRIPHISRLLIDEPKALFNDADVIVVATGETEFGELVSIHGDNKHIIDLVGRWSDMEKDVGSYDGIVW